MAEKKGSLQYCMGCGGVVHDWDIHAEFHDKLTEGFQMTSKVIQELLYFLGAKDA